MQYSRPMIELVYEIRRRVPADLKPGVKLANPDMPQELAVFYHQSKDVITKTLIKELLSLAGEPWINLIADKEPPIPRQIAKVYRGQTSLTDAPHDETRESAEAKADHTAHVKPVRIYRGREIK